MKISASIVTYNSIQDIDEVLECIKNSDCFPNIEVYLSDNNSSDGTSKHVERKYTFVKILRNEKNGGYGYGHNKVINRIDSDIHFIINPDIRFDSELLRKTAVFLNNSPDIAICTPEMKLESGGYVFPPKAQPRLHYVFARFLNQISILQKWRDDYTMKDKVINNNGIPFDIDFCSGAFMAIKTDYLKKVNGFDERFFLYYEDADLTIKLLNYGRCVCIPYLSVIHEGKREAYKSSKSRKIMIVSMIKFLSKWGWKI